MLPGDSEEVITNEQGGKQSRLDARLDLLPSLAILEIGKVLHHGAERYGEWNWKSIPIKDHISHAMTHLLRFALTRENEELSHAATRVLFALELFLEEQADAKF